MLKPKRKLNASDYSLIAANLVPVFGVWFLDWSPKEVFLIYCLETIIIGFMTLIKMGIVTAVRRTDVWYTDNKVSKQHGIFFMLFFIMHYGIFVGVQMGIFFGVSGMGSDQKITALNFFYKWPDLISGQPIIMLGTFFLFYIYKMIADFIIPRQYRTVSLMRLMFQPYGRIFIQQLTVIIGSMFLVFGGGKIFILIFAVVKIYCELYLNFDAYLQLSLKKMQQGSQK